MNSHLAIVAVLCFVGALYLGCDGTGGTLIATTGPTSGAGGGCAEKGDAGSPCGSFGDAGAGEPCADDCDCRGGACVAEQICAAPCS